MTIELVQTQPASRIDPNFEIAALFSLCGLAVTLALMPFIGIDPSTWLGLAG